MAYIKTNWIDDETVVNATRMNNIETGIENLQNVPLLAVSDTAPSECEERDKYFNTTSKKIFTATGHNTWGSTGEDPKDGMLYIVFSTKTTYSLDNGDLISVGGGAGRQIAISETEPTEDEILWINPEEATVEPEPEQKDYYSTTETKTNKVWIDGKPIYRLVKNIGYLPNNGRIVPSFEGLIPTTATITKLDGITHRYANDVHDYRPLADMVITFLYRPGMSALYVDTNQDVSNWECIAIIEYTK